MTQRHIVERKLHPSLVIDSQHSVHLLTMALMAARLVPQFVLMEDVIDLPILSQDILTANKV